MKEHSVKEDADRLIADRLGPLTAREEKEVAARAREYLFGGARGRVRLLRAYDAAAARSRSAIDCSCEPSIVQQQFADECDINTIVRRFGVQALEPRARPGAVYGDFTGITDWESAVERIQAARDGFNLLPAEIRERFGNDPGRFYAETGVMTAEQLDGLVPVVEPVKSATLDDVVAAVASLRPVEPPEGGSGK